MVCVRARVSWRALCGCVLRKHILGHVFCTFQLVRPSCCGVGEKFGWGQGWLNVGSFFMQSLQNSFISTLRSVGAGGRWCRVHCWYFLLCVACVSHFK